MLQAKIQLKVKTQKKQQPKTKKKMATYFLTKKSTIPSLTKKTSD